MTRKLRFYSAQENAFIQNYVKSKEPVKGEILEKFCVDNNRSIHSVSCKIYD